MISKDEHNELANHGLKVCPNCFNKLRDYQFYCFSCDTDLTNKDVK